MFSVGNCQTTDLTKSNLMNVNSTGNLTCFVCGFEENDYTCVDRKEKWKKETCSGSCVKVKNTVLCPIQSPIIYKRYCDSNKQEKACTKIGIFRVSLFRYLNSWINCFF